MKIVRILAALLSGLLFCLPAVGHGEKPQPVADGLPTALKLTVTQHPNVKSKLEELTALGFDLDAAKAQRYPTLGVQGSTNSRLTGPTPTTTDNYNSVMAVVKQPLWAGGRIDGGIDQAAVKQKIGTLALLDVQRQLMENTVTTYAAILGDRKRLAAALLNVSEHERLQTLITRRESGGIASEADIQLASSRLSLAVAQRLQLEATLLRSQNDLLALTQQTLPALEQVSTELTELPPTDRIAVDVEKVSAAVQQRLIEVELARNAFDLATAAMLPTLYAKMEQDLYTSTTNGEIPQGNRVGVVLEGNIDGLGVSGWKKVQSSESRVAAAKKNVESVRNDVRRQVQGLLTDLHSQRLVLQSNELLVQSTEKTLDSFMRQYDAARKSWVDVLNTQRELSDARLSLEQTRSALLTTKLRLATQCGLLDRLAGVAAL